MIACDHIKLSQQLQKIFSFLYTHNPGLMPNHRPNGGYTVVKPNKPKQYNHRFFLRFSAQFNYVLLNKGLFANILSKQHNNQGEV